MATKTSKPAAAPRPQAIVDTIDFDSAMDDEQFPTSARRSKWTELLDTLYAATEADQVPRSDDGSLRFVKLGQFGNPNGARTQIRSLVDKGLDQTYEFRAVNKSGASELWARVIEVPADEAPAEED